MSDSLWPHELQHPRPPCPSPAPRVYSNSCPLSQWCHPTISSSVSPFFSCFQSCPALGSFQMSQLFTSGGQSIRVSARSFISPSNEHPWLISFRMEWLDLLAVQGILKSLLQHHSSKASILQCSGFFKKKNKSIKRQIPQTLYTTIPGKNLKPWMPANLLLTWHVKFIPI